VKRAAALLVFLLAGCAGQQRPASHGMACGLGSRDFIFRGTRFQNYRLWGLTAIWVQGYELWIMQTMAIFKYIYREVLFLEQTAVYFSVRISEEFNIINNFDRKTNGRL
jgi:hypothetical protein